MRALLTQQGVGVISIVNSGRSFARTHNILNTLTFNCLIYISLLANKVIEKFPFSCHSFNESVNEGSKAFEW